VNETMRLHNPHFEIQRGIATIAQCTRVPLSTIVGLHGITREKAPKATGLEHGLSFYYLPSAVKSKLSSQRFFGKLWHSMATDNTRKQSKDVLLATGYDVRTTHCNLHSPNC
jgi:hypothetical protein